MKKLWGIRHIRYYYLSVKFNVWWFSVGQCLGACPNQNDVDYLNAVWKGEA